MTSKELKEKFLPLSLPFTEPVEWQDGIGFSTVEDQLNNHASLYKIGFYEQNQQKDINLKKLWISATYGKKIKDGISLGSEKESISDPVTFDSHDEYYYNIQTDKFYYHGNEITPKGILQKIRDLHIKPTKPIKGIFLRLKLVFWRKMLPGMVKFVDLILIYLLWLISGEETTADFWRRLSKTYEKIKKEEVQFNKPPDMEFFGYEAKRWPIVFYCALHLVVYIFLYRFDVYFILTSLFKNNFLAVCYVVVSFCITESGIPRLLKEMIKITPKIFHKIAFMTVKI